MEKYENGEEIVVVGKISDISHQVQFETETTKVILEDVILRDASGNYVYKSLATTIEYYDYRVSPYTAHCLGGGC